MIHIQEEFGNDKSWHTFKCEYRIWKRMIISGEIRSRWLRSLIYLASKESKCVSCNYAAYGNQSCYETNCPMGLTTKKHRPCCAYSYEDLVWLQQTGAIQTIMGSRTMPNKNLKTKMNKIYFADIHSRIWAFIDSYD